MSLAVGSLFAGIGGFDLAARWLGWRTLWYSEIDPYASAVMKKRFPDAVNHGDVTQLRGSQVARVDVLCGGFPCQDISLAGKGAGIEGSRSGLWTHYARIIDEVRPSWVVVENVSALRSRGLDRVLGSLAALGYDAEWHCIPAAYVGAPHRRDRIWIVAHPNADESRSQGWDRAIVRECARQQPVGPMGALADADRELLDRSAPLRSSRRAESTNSGSREVVAHTDRVVGNERGGSDPGQGEGRRHADRSVVGAHELADAECSGVSDDRQREVVGSPGSMQREAPERERLWADARERHNAVGVGEWWQSEPDVGRVAHGVPSRVDRLRCLGNAIVPQVAAFIFQAIYDREIEMRLL